MSKSVWRWRMKLMSFKFAKRLWRHNLSSLRRTLNIRATFSFYSSKSSRSLSRWTSKVRASTLMHFRTSRLNFKRISSLLMIFRKSTTSSCRSRWRTSKRSSSQRRDGSPSTVISKTLTLQTSYSAHAHLLPTERWYKRSNRRVSVKLTRYNQSNSSIRIKGSTHNDLITTNKLQQDLTHSKVMSTRCSEFHSKLRTMNASTRAKASLTLNSRACKAPRFNRSNHSKTSQWMTAAQEDQVRTRWLRTTD